MFPWPFVALVAVAALAVFKELPSRLGQMIRPLHSIKVLGAELTLTEQEASQVEHTAQEVLTSYRRTVNAEYDRLARYYAIAAQFEQAIEKASRASGIHFGAISGLRATLYVEDELIEDHLYQLIDYYPEGGGHGRTFSMRFGIIGRTWRLRESQLHEEVPTDAKELVLNWGMTKQQAQVAGQGRQSFSCTLLRDANGAVVGLVFIDARERSAFKGLDPAEQRAFHDSLSNACDACAVTYGMASLSKELRNRVPRLAFK